MKPAEWGAVLLREARNPRPPREVHRLFEAGGIDPAEFAVILMAAWGSCVEPPPLRQMSRETWIRMFRHVGYLYNGARAEIMRSSEPITLYRAAAPEYRRGISWTASLSDAHFYLSRPPHRERHLYTITAEPGWMLGRISPRALDGRGGEYLVDVPNGVAERCTR